MGGRRKCLICKSQDSPLMRLPLGADDNKKKLWCELANVDEWKPSYRLCALHFEEEFLPPSNWSVKRLRLKGNAVPTLRRCPEVSVDNGEQEEEDTDDQAEKIVCSVDVIGVNIDEVKEEEEKEEEDENEHVATEDTETMDSCQAHACPACGGMLNRRSYERNASTQTDMVFTSPSQGTSSALGVSSNETSNSLSRKIPFPRYFLDLKAPDLATPEGAALALQLGKSALTESRKKVKVLQMQKSRLEKKLSSVKEVLDSLKKKGLLSSGAMAALKVYMNGEAPCL